MTTLLNGNRATDSNSRRKKVALVAVQDSPVSFDLSASIAKLGQLCAKAAQQARDQADGQDIDIVVVFPEAFLSCYPRGYGVSHRFIHILPLISLCS